MDKRKKSWCQKKVKICEFHYSCDIKEKVGKKSLYILEIPNSKLQNISSKSRDIFLINEKWRRTKKMANSFEFSLYHENPENNENCPFQAFFRHERRRRWAPFFHLTKENFSSSSETRHRRTKKKSSNEEKENFSQEIEKKTWKICFRLESDSSLSVSDRKLHPIIWILDILTLFGDATWDRWRSRG